MGICVMVENTFQYVNKVINETHSTTSYYYWVCFTPNKNCKITEVKFLWDYPYNWVLRILQWNYADGSWTAYTINSNNNPSWVYTLETPYQLTANTNYVVCLIWNWVWSKPSNNNAMTWYPVKCRDITYNYATTNYNKIPFTWNAYYISWLMIE